MKNLIELKKQAAIQAVGQVGSGMLVGLGTGSTAAFAVEELSRKLKTGELKDIKCIPTSTATKQLANELGVPLTEFSIGIKIDLTIDGADEVDSQLNLIKGGGGALLHEKIVAEASKELIIVVDDTKLSDNLGEVWHVPVEVIPFAKNTILEFLISLGAVVNQRMKKDGSEFRTDENNIILDAAFGLIFQPEILNMKLNSKSGIVEHGLFIGLADKVIAASSEGIKEILKD